MKALCYRIALMFVAISATMKTCEGTSRSPQDIITNTTLNEEEKAFSVLRHNQARKNTSPSASNMQKVFWDEELGVTAQEYSRKCIYAHSTGRKTSKFDWVGENLYVGSPEVEPIKILNTAITHWDDEKYNYTYATTACTVTYCSHYTQVVWDDTWAVGCAMTTCRDLDVGDGETWEVGQLVVCHYGPGGNLNNRQPFDLGAHCSVCPKDFVCEDNLCTNSAYRVSVPFAFLVWCAIFLFAFAFYF